MQQQAWQIVLSAFVLTLVANVAAAAQERADATATKSQNERLWTLMVYAAVDNDAETGFMGDLRAALRYFQPDRGIELVLLIDRSANFTETSSVFGEDFTDTRLYRLGSDGPERIAGGDVFPEITLDSNYEANTADPETLAKFVRFAKREFPARWHGLVIYGHANGQVMLPDEEPAGRMTPTEFSEGLGRECAVDLMVTDVCSMGGVETAYEWRPGGDGFEADVLCTIPSAGEALPWAWIFRRVSTLLNQAEASEAVPDAAAATNLSPEALAATIVEQTAAFRKFRLQSTNPSPRRRKILGFECAAAYSLAHAEPVKAAVDRLAVTLHHNGSKEALEALRGPISKPTAMYYTHNMAQRWYRMPYFDAVDLARRIQASDAFHADVRVAAAEVVDSVDALVIDSFGMGSLEGFVPGQNGVYIMFPDGDEPLPPAVVEQTPEAANTPQLQRAFGEFSWHEASHGRRGYGLWAFSRDGAIEGNGNVENWFELLDAWYDDPSVANGGLNRYAW